MKNMKKSLAGILLAVLLVIGYFTGIIPLDNDVQGNDLAITSAITVDDEKSEVKATEAPTEKATAKPTKAPTEKPTAKPTEKPTEEPTEEPAGPITDPQGIADYIFEHGELPDNFITKKEAQALGWDSSENYVGDVAPGKSIGGDRFGNYEGLLPKKSGRQYFEADCYYEGKKRNGHRIVYSNDGLVFYTSDHYESFTEMKPSK